MCMMNFIATTDYALCKLKSIKFVNEVISEDSDRLDSHSGGCVCGPL